MNRFGPSFVISVLLHVGLFLLAWITWTHEPKSPVTASVPVELVSSVPMHQQVETPVDKQAVKTPVPEPAPEDQPKPTPPTPAPKLPVPTPQKEVVKPTPVKTPEPPKPTPPKPAPVPTPAPPDKNGLKKPQPDTSKAKPAKAAPPAKPALDLDALSQLAASPSKTKTRSPAQANTHATNGNSVAGSAPADAGQQTDLTALTNKLKQLWNPNCDIPGANQIVLEIKFTISPSGRVIQGPEWINRRNDPIWIAAASRALSAVKQGELYDDLPKAAYNVPITYKFDGHSACGG